MHADALAHGARVRLVHDDLLATGGTARALAEPSSGSAGPSSAAVSWSSWRSSRAGGGPEGFDVHTLIAYDEE